jgi:CRP-like cAMP-binding protein
MEEILKMLHSIHALSPELRAYLLNTVQYKTLKKGEYLLQAEQVCRYLYFIESGAVSCYYLKDDERVYSWFMETGDVITSVPSYFTRKPGYEFIQARRDCVLHALSFDDAQYAFHQFMEFNFIARVMTEKYYQQSEERLYALRKRSAPEKCRYLREHWGHLEGKIPQKELASYMDMGRRTMVRFLGAGTDGK